ncbi:hypothetical protein IV203_033210 [Nitzschia inconspicua]|uniref:Uncharacterized protein n=1 Tax=Nitzschia inconspicua TaxID=303405 RepID=A0A9K3KKZ2_9STRA|nr:hypothetical protein IV203_033210 [Nitzschia inconspicua]
MAGNNASWLRSSLYVSLFGASIFIVAQIVMFRRQSVFSEMMIETTSNIDFNWIRKPTTCKDEYDKKAAVGNQVQGSPKEHHSALFSHSTTTYLHINSPVFAKQQQLIMNRPTENNLVIAMISMGPNRSYLVQRAIRSIRTSGKFNGYILVLTDEEGYEFYSKTIPANDTKLIVMQGRDEDLNARHAPANSTVSKNETRPFCFYMLFKRFKTVALSYISEHPTLDAEMEYAFYMDIDNVVFQTLQDLWDDYYTEFPKKYGKLIEEDSQRLAAANITYPYAPVNNFVSFWKEPPNKDYWQSGQILYHRKYSQGCMDHWKFQIEADFNYCSYMEQPLLMQALEYQYNVSFFPGQDPPVPICHVVELPDRPKHFDVAHYDIVKERKVPTPTFVHFTNVRVAGNTVEDQLKMFMKALHLRYKPNPKGDKREFAKTVVSMENDSPYLYPADHEPISWESIITPRDTRGKERTLPPVNVTSEKVG